MTKGEQIPEVGQQQTQYINVSSAEHGMTDEVRCAYASYSVAQMPSWLKGEMVREKYVKLLFFQGEVKRVLCHHLKGRKCVSPLRSGNDSECHLLEPKRT